MASCLLTVSGGEFSQFSLACEILCAVMVVLMKLKDIKGRADELANDRWQSYSEAMAPFLLIK